MFHDNLVLIILTLLLVLIIGWLVKKYFSINTKALEKSRQENKATPTSPNPAINKVYTSGTPQTEVASPATITESNNELSNKRFDGINQNPEYQKKKSSSLVDEDSAREIPDLANESVYEQAHVKSDN